MANFPTLYTRDASGATRFWRMELGPTDASSYRSVSGVLGGAEVPTGWTKAVPKNVGRSNATTAEQQALLEVEAQYKQKRDRKYHDTVEGVGGHKFFAPMLAKGYESYVRQLLGLTAFIQPKLDGFRCVASIGGLYSRQGKPFNLPHITEALAGAFEEDPDLILDGELYNHDLREDFNTLGSLIKKGNRSAAEEERVRSTIQYHLYDAPSVFGNFSERDRHLDRLELEWGWIQECSQSPIRLVETHGVVLESELDARYVQFMEQGYEGAMVRLDMPYEVGKRSKALLKRKDFQDAEFRLRSVQEGVGNWAGYAKTATIRLEDGRDQSSGLRGSQEFTRQLLDDWEKYTYVTVRFQNRTPDGFLRFPVITAWHEGERDY